MPICYRNVWSALQFTSSPTWEVIRSNCQFRCGEFESLLKTNVKSTKYLIFLAFTRFLFDTNCPLGYFIAVIIEYFVVGYELIVVACTLALGIGAYWFAKSITKEIQRIRHSINDAAQENQNQSNELKLLISEYIHLHASMKQLSTYTGGRRS